LESIEIVLDWRRRDVECRVIYRSSKIKLGIIIVVTLAEIIEITVHLFLYISEWIGLIGRIYIERIKLLLSLGLRLLWRRNS
jgi:hypothetical protein